MAANRRELESAAQPDNACGWLHQLEARELFAAVAWDGGGDGRRFFDPHNWAGDVLPGPDDNVEILRSARPILIDRSVSVGSLRALAPIRLSSGTLHVGSDATFEAALRINPGATLRSERGSVRASLRGEGRLSSGLAFAPESPDTTITVLGAVSAREIALDSGSRAILRISGTIDAAGRRDAVSGGSIQLLGREVSLEGARLNASGGDSTGPGGTINVGGSYQGRGPLPGAIRTTADEATVICADGGVSGAGGTVIIWSDDRTDFGGVVSARGGAAGGDGGFVEISGSRELHTTKNHDLSSPRGSAGTILYDPLNIQIVGGTADGSDNPDASATNLINASGSNTPGSIAFTDEGQGSPNPFVVRESEIEGTNANIILQARNSITTSGTFVAGEVLLQNNRSLTLQTRNNGGDGAGAINLTGSTHGAALIFRTQGTGTITIEAGQAGVAAASVSLCSLTTAGQNMFVRSFTSNVTLNGLVTTGSSSVGTVRLAAASTISQSGGSVVCGTLALYASGDALLTQATNNLSALAATNGGAAGRVEVAASSGLSTGSVAASGGYGVITGLTTNNGDVLLDSGTGSLSVTNPISAGTGSVRIVSGDNVTQSATIAAAALGVRAMQSVTLTTPTNQVGVFAANVSSINAVVSYRDSDALTIGSVAAKGTFAATSGVLTGAQDVLIQTGGDLTIAQSMGAGGGSPCTVRLVSGGAITQTAGSILGAGLGARSVGPIDLSSASNDIVTFAASAAGSVADVKYTDFSACTVGTITASGAFASTSGVSSTTGDVYLRSGGPLSLTQNLAPGAGGGLAIVWIMSTGSITQSSGTIVADSLSVSAAGAVDLSQSGNNVATVAISNTGAGSSVSYRDGDAATVGTVVASGTFPLVSGVTTSNGSVLLHTGAALFLNAGIAAGTATVRIVAAGVSQPGGGAIVAGGLGLNVPGSCLLDSNSNNVTTFAAQNSIVASPITYHDADGFQIDTVTGSGTFVATSGVATNDGNILLRAVAGTIMFVQPVSAGSGTVRILGGSVNQVASGVIAAATLGISASGSVMLTAAANLVGTLAATTGAISSILTYRDADAVSIGSVAALGPFPGVSGFGAASSQVQLETGGGIVFAQSLIGPSGYVTRVLAGGSISQTGGLVLADVLGLRAGGAITLNAAGNDVVTLAATSSFGAAAITYTDANGFEVGNASAFGNFAAVNGVVSTNGAVTLSSAGTLALQGSITAGSASIVLNSTAGGITQEPAAAIATTYELTVTSIGNVALEGLSNAVAVIKAASVLGSFSFRNSGGLDIAGASVTGTLSITTSGGSITDSGVISAGGAATFVTLSPGRDVTLDFAPAAPSFSFSTVGPLGDVVLSTGNSVVLAASTIEGSITVTVNAGSITDAGPVTVAGFVNLTITTPDSGDVICDQVADVADVVFHTFGTNSDVTFTSSGSFSLAGSSVGGALDVTCAGGSLSTYGPTTASGMIQLTAAGAITLGGESILISPGMVSLFAGQSVSFGNLAAVWASDVTIDAGDGLGGNATASIDLPSSVAFSGPSGSVTSPNSISLTQDASISDADLPDLSSYGGGLPAVLAFASRDGSITLNTAAKVQGSALDLSSAAGATIGAPTLSLASVSVTGPLVLAGGSISTTGDQTYHGAVSLAADTSMTGSALTFFGSVDSDTVVRSLTLSFSGGTSLSGGLGAMNPLASLSLQGAGLVTFTGSCVSVSTTGAQNYAQAIQLERDVALSGASLSLLGSVNADLAASNRTLSLFCSGLTVLGDPIGDTQPLGSLITNAGGSTRIAAVLHVVNALTLGDAAELAADASLVSDSGTVTIASTLDADSSAANRHLVLTGVGVIVSGAIGSAQALGSLTVSPGTSASLFSGVTTSGNQDYSGPVTISSAAALAVTGGAGVVSFNSTLSVAAELTVSSDEINLAGPASPLPGGGLRFQPATPTLNINIAGAASTAALDLTAAELALLGDGFGAVRIGSLTGSGVMSIAASNWSDPTRFDMPGAGGKIFVNGALTTSGNGSLAFYGSGSTIVLNADVTTNGTPIVFNDAVEIGVPLVTVGTTGGGTIGADITFAFKLNSESGEGNSIAIISGVGTSRLQGDVGGNPSGKLATLTTDAPGQTLIQAAIVTTLGNQQYGNHVVVSIGSFISSDSGAITLQNGLDTGPTDTTLRADEVDFTGGSVQGANTLRIEPQTLSRTVNLGGTTDDPNALDLLNAEVARFQPGFLLVQVGRGGGTGTGNINSPNVVNNTEFVMNGAGSSINMNGYSGTGGGSITVKGSGATTRLRGLVVTSGLSVTILDALIVEVANAQIDTTRGGQFPAGGDIFIQGTVNSAVSQRHALTLKGGAASTTLNSSVGDRVNGELGSLTTDAAGVLTLNGVLVRTRDAQTFGESAVNIGANLTIQNTNNAAPITFSGSVSGAGNVTIAPNSGPVTFNGDVGGGGSLNSLTINFGSTRVFNGAATVGVLTINGGEVVFNGVTTATAGVFVSGFMKGAGDVTFSLPFTWVGGEMSGTGKTVISPAGSLILSGGAKTLKRTIENYGSAFWADGDLRFESGNLRNKPGAVMYVQSSGTFLGVSGGNFFANEGLVERAVSPSSSITNLNFTNTGTLRLLSGALNVTPAGGLFTNAGDLSLGPAATLAVTGSIALAPTSTIAPTLAGANPSQNYGRITATGAIALGGTLQPRIDAAFHPSRRQLFDLLSAGTTMNGAFGSLLQPINIPGSLEAVYMQVGSLFQLRLDGRLSLTTPG
ncbi:MAG: hypothetical protein JNM07_06605 [Phycisphaerae bacterium]|nr:hypothetical protein [Phycisphaerae bacterium]